MNAAFRFDDWDTPSPTTTPSGAGKFENSPKIPVDRTNRESSPESGLSPVLAPINAADKRIVNGQADINQLAPFKYPWAWEFFLKANRNHWTPLEIAMAQDVHDYQHKLSAAERHVFENVLAYLTTSDILAMRNIGLAVMEKMSAPELQIYQARQVYEEALHTWTYQHCIESLGLDQQEIYNRYRVVPEIHGKIALANRRLERVMRADFDLTDRANLHEFALSYFFFAVIFEGCWFYNGFTPIFALQRRGLMKGAAEQLQYIMRDEVLHCAFGIRVIRELLKEEGMALDPQALRSLPRRPKQPTPATSCANPSSATTPNCISPSSASSPTGGRGRSASRNLSRAQGTSCPGSTSRPTCARKKTSSKPGSPSTRRAGRWPGSNCRAGRRLPWLAGVDDVLCLFWKDRAGDS
jgi:ribonucleoside-diphosphate reductase beta chain